MLAAALACSVLGFAWLALAMDVHWHQARGAPPPSLRLRRTLRALGALALAASLALCLRTDHASMAVLVWVMALAAGALAVAFTLSWRPRWLRAAVVWVRVPRRLHAATDA